MLADNRWHIDCFRCTTCSIILDPDEYHHFLDDGSLACNGCTYSCSVCNNNIENLAILIGDQAFCSICFKCRNCKKRIEGLKYARTSRGISCMECHELLMECHESSMRRGRKVSLPMLPPPAASEPKGQAPGTPQKIISLAHPANLAISFFERRRLYRVSE